MFIFNRKCITTELDHGGMLSFTAREHSGEDTGVKDKHLSEELPSLSLGT